MSATDPVNPEVEPDSRDVDDVGAPLDLAHYLRIIRKRLWIIVAVLAVGVTATVLYTMRQTKIYRATSSIIIDPQPPAVFGNQVQEVITLGTGSYWANQEYYNTQIEVLESFDLARVTVERNDLHERPELVPPIPNDTRTEEQRKDIAASALAGALSVNQSRESRVMRISVRHPDRQLAIELANKHIDTYLAYVKGLRTGGTDKVSRFLSKELDDAEARLRESEQKLIEFKKDNNILSVSLEEKLNILAQDIGRYTDALGETRVKRIQLHGTLVRARKSDLSDPFASPIFALTGDTQGAALKTQYQEERRKLLELSAELGPRHPVYLAQKEKVDALEATALKEAKRALGELEEQYQALRTTEGQFEAELERLKQEAFDLGPKAVAYKRLERKQKSDEEAYNLVLGRLRTSDLTGRNEAINVRPHSMARGAALVHPRLRFNIIVAFMLSLMLGIGLAFLLEFMDRSIKSADQVEALVNAPVLGVIPVVADVGGGDPLDQIRTRDLWVHDNPTSRAAECCRSIRTNILFASADRPMKTITVSSPRPREGKTTSTIYVGTTMAQSGQKVLLIDTDLRRPRLHKSMGVARNLGLTTLLLGEADIDDVIKTTDIPNLYVLPCGPQPPNPAELLLTNRFKEVLGQLEERFDRILLDSPPLTAVTDAVVLARLSDGVVIVVQAGSTRIDDAVQCARALRDVRAPILGVILNDLDLDDRRYGYGYKYYSYGYGDKATEGDAG